MGKKYNLPAMPLYWGDIFKSPDLMALSKELRDTFWLMLGRMWESSERGVLLINGFVPTDEELSSMLLFGLDNQKCNHQVNHLVNRGIFSRRDSDGAIYSRRMVDDEEVRAIRRDCGKKGGNPALLVNHKVKVHLNQNTEDEDESVNEKKKKKDSDLMIPAHLAEEWPHYLEMRKKIKKPATERAQQLALARLEKLAPGNTAMQVEIVQKSVQCDWQDFYPLKDDAGAAPRRQYGRQDVTTEELQAQAARLMGRLK